jgi:hypothetical protein
MKKFEKIFIPTLGCLNLKNSILSFRKLIFINDCVILGKVLKKEKKPSFGLSV